MTTYDKNKEKIPNLDNFKDSKNNFLNDIYKKAQKYNLSDRQVYAANKAYQNIIDSGGKTPWEQNVEQFPEIKDFKDKVEEMTFETDYKTRDIVYDMLSKASKYKLSEKQIGFLKKLYNGLQEKVGVSENIYKVLEILTKCSPRSDFAEGFYLRFAQNKYDKMNKKDYDTMVGMLIKYKRCMMKRIFK